MSASSINEVRKFGLDLFLKVSFNTSIDSSVIYIRAFARIFAQKSQCHSLCGVAKIQSHSRFYLWLTSRVKTSARQV